jgi:hypothetical protein
VVVHLLSIDLADPRVRFWTTPADPGDGEKPHRARTTLEAVEEFRLLAAVNGDHFGPFHANGPWDYFPHVGDRVFTRGPSVAAGVRTTPTELGYFAKRNCTLSIMPDRSLVFGAPEPKASVAISGGPFLVRHGRPAATPGHEPCPQTALAATYDQRLWMIVVDGRQPGYSEGLNDAEFAAFLAELGCDVALRLDGGGSSTMVARDAAGRPCVLNQPIHAGVPGWQRPVANHFGVYVVNSE